MCSVLAANLSTGSNKELFLKMPLLNLTLTYCGLPNSLTKTVSTAPIGWFSGS